MWKCKYCKKEYKDTSQKASHIRWCKSNPKYEQYLRILKKVRKNRKKEWVEKMKIGVLEAWKEGKYKHVDFGKTWLGRKHTEKTKRKMSQTQRNNTYQRVCKSTIFYKGVKMDSTYEVRTAKILDKLNIKWERPKPLVWVDVKSKNHHYFPDFYCEKYDVYLDPKNDYCFEVQKEKINYIKKYYKNVFFLRENEIEEKYILGLMVKRKSL